MAAPIAAAASSLLMLTFRIGDDKRLYQTHFGARTVSPAQNTDLNVEALPPFGERQVEATAIRATRKWGRIVFLGEGGRVEFNPSPDIIHDQKTIYGSWVTSTWLMEELVERLVRWNLHPADLVTHRFPLDKVEDAYSLMASGRCGKVAVCFDEELVAQ